VTAAATPRFWEMESAEIERAVELEVYRAIEEFLTSNDPNTLLYWLRAPAGPDSIALHLCVEGRGIGESIERDFCLRDLVKEHLEGYLDLEGQPSLSDEDRENLAVLADGFYRLAGLINGVIRQ
jgi:hypothetical protein